MRKIYLAIVLILIFSVMYMPLTTADLSYITPAWNGDTAHIYQLNGRYYFIENTNSSIWINLSGNQIFSIYNLTFMNTIEIYLYNTTYNYYWNITAGTNSTISLPVSSTPMMFTGGDLIISLVNGTTTIYWNNQSYSSSIYYDQFVIYGYGQASWTSWSTAIYSAPLHKDFTLLVFGLTLLGIGFGIIYMFKKRLEL